MMINKIFLETKNFQSLIYSLPKSDILVVTNASITFMSNLNDYRSANIYNLIYLPKDNMIINSHQFIYLINHALMPEYKIMIFNLDSVTPEFVKTFNIFYFESIKPMIYKNQTKLFDDRMMIFFLKNLDQKNQIYLHSHQEKSFTEKDMEEIISFAKGKPYSQDLKSLDFKSTFEYPQEWNIMSLEFKYKPSLEEYFKILYCLDHDYDMDPRISKVIHKILEPVNYELTFLLAKNVELLKNIENYENYYQYSCKLSRIDKILKNSKKYTTIMDIFKEYSDNNIYIYSENTDGLEKLMIVLLWDLNGYFTQSNALEKIIKDVNESKFKESINCKKKENTKEFNKQNNGEKNSCIQNLASDESKFKIFKYDSSNLNGDDQNILIFYDKPCSLDFRPFNKIYIFDEDDNVELLTEIKSSLKKKFDEPVIEESETEMLEENQSAPEFLFKYLSETIPRYVNPISSATIIYKYSHSFLLHILNLFKSVFDNNFLFFQNIEPTIQYEIKGALYQCKITLPLIHNHQIFENQFVSSFHQNKKQSLQEVSMTVIKNLVGFFIDDHLIPIEEQLIRNNDVYYHYMYETYQSDINFDGIFMKNNSKMNDITPDNINNSNMNKKEVNKNNEENLNIPEYNYLENVDHELLIQRLIELHERYLEDNKKYNNDNSKKELLYPDFVYQISRSFKKKYRVELPSVLKTDIPNNNLIENVYRIQPKCLSSFPDEYYIYYFEELNDRKNENFKEKKSKKKKFSIEMKVNDKNIKTDGNKEGENMVLGLACGKSFTEDVKFANINVKFLKSCRFTNDQLDSLFFFQVLFFGLHYHKQSKKNDIKCCYLAIPLKNNDIDWDLLNLHYKKFIISNVIEGDKKLLKENLLFNPFNKMFYVYLGESKLNLDSCFYSKTGKTTYKKYFENKYEINLVHTEGENLLFNGGLYYCNYRIKKKKGCELSDNLNNPEALDLDENNEEIKNKKTNDLGKEDVKSENEEYIYLNEDNDLNNEKLEEFKPNILSSEVIHITSIKRNYVQHYEKFKKYLYIFENIAVTDEFRDSVKIDIPLTYFSTCFISRIHSKDNYERTEFLGDTILKYVVSKHFFLKNYKLSCLVDSKCKVICNENLFKIAEKMGIQKYYSFFHYSDSLFQPPALYTMIEKYSELEKELDIKNENSRSENWLKFLEYFKIDRIFKSNSRFEYFKNIDTTNYISSGERMIMSKKVYADILESILGTYYIHNNLELTEKLIKKLNIIDNSECGCGECNRKKECDKSTDTQQLRSTIKISNSIFNIIHGINKRDSEQISDKNQNINSDFYINHQVLNNNHISEIESILKYTFKNKGILEQAVVHPSYKENKYSSENFQKLELLGDSVYDVLITERIYKEYPDADPNDLHLKRKELVSNKTFGKSLNCLGLFKYIKISDQIKRDLILNKTNIEKTKLEDEDYISNEFVNLNYSKNLVNFNKVFGDIFEAICGAILIDCSFNFNVMRKYFDGIYGIIKKCKTEVE